MRFVQPRRVTAISVLAFLLASTVFAGAHEARSAVQTSTTGTFISISDIHFNPFYDPTLASEVAKSDYTKWQAIFARSSGSGLGSYHADVNFNLLSSALDNMQKQSPHPDFIIISGDFLAHDFQKTFKDMTGNHDPKAIAAFSDQTIKFLTMMIADRFPGTTVYPALGNNDSDCDDYAIQPSGSFLQATATTWQPLVKGSPNAADFMQTFPASGTYSLLSPNSSKHRIIALNTTFVSSNYKNPCGVMKGDPGKDELDWLAAELKKAAAANEKVWLLYHILPGIDVFDSLSASTPKKPQAITFWRSDLNQTFVDLVKQYSDTIVVSFGGHIHMDNFQLVQSKQQAVSFVHVSPAISPKFGNNPGFEVFSYDRQSSMPLDYTTYFIDVTSAAAKKGPPVTWPTEYSFVNDYKQPAYSTAALQAMYQLLPGNNSTWAKYLKYYNVSRRGSVAISSTDRRAYWCGMANLIETDYLTCLAGK
jgi:sphingomyelin phosphodiesterase acid-like 3